MHSSAKLLHAMTIPILTVELEIAAGEWPQSWQNQAVPVLGKAFETYYRFHKIDSQILSDHLEFSINLTLADDELLQTLNNEWRDKDKPTNVLSFPTPTDFMLPPDQLACLGDIFLSLDRIMEEAEAQQKQPIHHFIHLLIHGMLHLMGEDHQTSEMAERMEAIEISLLKAQNIENPYL